jgi:[ribosomal protein S5]-alanine N-acetyltransferase
MSNTYNNIKIDTERLILRELNESDASFIYELMNTEPWKQNIGERNILELIDAENYIINVYQKGYLENGFGLYAMILKASMEAIGVCGILKRDTLKFPDIGFALLPQFFGQNYAFEAAQACLEYARDVLKIPVIQAIVLPENLSSIRLLEKLGMKEIEQIVNEKKEVLLLFSN